MADVLSPLFQEVVLTRAPLLILDPRDGYASWFGTGADLLPDTNGNRVPAVVRVTATVTVVANPAAPNDPKWPFPAGVELVLVRTPSGLLAFFGRVRSTGGPLRRLPLLAARARLTASAPGYVTHDLGAVDIPGPDGPTTVLTFEMAPDPSYPFPTGQQPNGNPGPTLLVGSVVNPDGTGVSGVPVSVVGQPGISTTNTNDLGGWVLVLDQRSNRQTVASPIAVTFGLSGGAVTVSGITFTPGFTTRLARTSLRGVARLADGRGAAGVTVTVADFAGESHTRPDGSWVFCLGVGKPAPDDPTIVSVPNPTPPPMNQFVRPVTVRFKPPGRAAVEKANVPMTVGGSTQVDTVTV